MKSKILLFLFLLCFPAWSQSTEASPRLLIHLLDYIALDYGGAVQNGKILSASEYAEQVEFMNTAMDTAQQLEVLRGSPIVQQGLNQLKQLIQNKASIEQVIPVARKIENEVIRMGAVDVAPSKWPNLHRGKEAYQRNCVQCHGPTGHGDGPAGGSMDPRPADFYASKMDGISPFQMFNTIRLGVSGTAMAAFSAISDEETWDLAFYVASLRHEGVPKAKAIENQSTWTLGEVATKSDSELRQNFLGSRAEAHMRLIEVRNFQVTEEGASALLLFAQSRLSESLELVKIGNFDAAKNKAIQAYLEGLEPLEPKLRLKDSLFTASLEGKMALFRSQVDRKAPIQEIENTLKEVQTLFGKADGLLKAGASSFGITFSVAAGIFLREAFEAALLLIALLGVIRTLGSTKAALFVHGGWILALLVGILSWVFSGWVMGISGLQRELLEGSISFFAVIILLYFGFWLHRKTEIGKWHTFINEMVKSAMDNKKLLGLGVVAFMGVFREAFETVLFLRALLLESPGQELALGVGVGSAFVFVVIASAFAIKYSARLPIRQLFGLSSFMMVFLAFVLFGKSVHSFQEAGFVSMTPVSMNMSWELLGIFPSYESLVPQVVLVVVSLFLWIKSTLKLQLPERSI